MIKPRKIGYFFTALIIIVFGCNFIVTPIYATIIGSNSLAQAGTTFASVPYGSQVVENFSTVYYQTEVTFTVTMGEAHINSMVNFSIYDEQNFNLFIENKTCSAYLHALNAGYLDNYTVTLGPTGVYAIIIWNNIPSQEFLAVSIRRSFNDDPLFNPATIPVYLTFGLVVIIVTVSGVLFLRKYR